MDEVVLQVGGKKTMNKEKISARVIDFGIKIFAIFGYHTSRSREYEFAMNNIPSKGNRISDVGSTGSLFPLKLAKKGYEVYAIDVREYHEKHPNLTVVSTDIENTPFSDDFFDVITCVSTIEHIGLGGYEDPKV
ncbi:MAG: methyltransferase domain-containing protein [Nitrospiraceae bacterium]|nr:methyltransferase domain-containing protein [Nitrospiraceae bacterium]